MRVPVIALAHHLLRRVFPSEDRIVRRGQRLFALLAKCVAIMNDGLRALGI